MKWDMYSENKAEKIICTKFYKPDYGIMHFVCLEKSEKYFKVLINFSQVKYLPKKDTYKFVTWEKYILQSFGIRRTLTDVKEGHSGQAFRKSNREDAEIITLPEGEELLCPIEIKDNWVKVRYDCYYNLDNHPYEEEPCHNYIDKCEPSLTAWTKWREQNRILIDIFLMP
jgi:hypothetical protein